MRVAAGLALAVLGLLLLVQGLVALAVRDVTDDYVARFMRGTTELLVRELAPLDAAARIARVRELDERFAYPVALVPAATFDTPGLDRLAAGELRVLGFSRRVVTALPPAAAAAAGDAVAQPVVLLVLGPLDADWNPEHRLQLPREFWLQAATAVLLALIVGLLAWRLLQPAWQDLRALRRAADALVAGRLGEPMPALRSRLFAPVGAALRETLLRLAGALAAQRELTSGVSHELRTPLARLRFAIDALAQQPDAAERERAAQACERDIDELEGLVDASLMLARLDVGAVRAVPAAGDLACWLARELASIAPLLQPHAVSSDVSLEGPVCFDARLLPYALRNGLRNAARHARSRIDVSAWLEPAAGGEPARVCVAVDDDGPGVPAALREAVFEPFRRLDGERERAQAGFGLGLGIARRIAESHGGRASIRQAPLGGARLLLEWPAFARAGGQADRADPGPGPVQ